MIYEAPEIVVEPQLNDVIQASNGGNIYLPDHEFDN